MPACISMSQTSNNSYKQWLETSIQEGSIYCCAESDIKLDSLHIGLGEFGVVYKATIEHNDSITTTISDKKQNIYSGMTVAVKILFPDKHGGSEEDLHQQLVKEVAIVFLLCLPHVHIS